MSILCKCLPLLSIIIPTYGRSESLKRAINSALQITDECEVVVVPNGDSDLWKRVANDFEHEKRVKWFPLDRANVSAARNHGLAKAQGQFVRFLDDDYFYLENARKQLQVHMKHDLDVSCGIVECC